MDRCVIPYNIDQTCTIMTTGNTALVRNGSNGSSSSTARYSVGLGDEAPKVVHDGGVARHRLVLDDTVLSSGGSLDAEQDAFQRLAALEAECLRLRQLLA